MNKDLERIKMILRGLPTCSMAQYNRLLEVYGSDLVNAAKKELLNEFDEQSNETDENCISANEYYAKDLKRLVMMKNDDKKKQLCFVCSILEELNNLLNQVDNMIIVYDDKRVPWICDKIDYAIKNCNDLDLLDKIKIVYDKYIKERNILLESYLKYVLMTAKSFFYSSEQLIPLDDIVQYGNMGLIRAIELFDIKQDKAFLTYATYWIKQSIIYNCKKHNNHMLFPLRWFDIKSKKGKVFEQLTQDFGRYPSEREISIAMNISVDMIDMISSSLRPFESLNELNEIMVDELSDEISNAGNLSKIEFISDMSNIDEKIIHNEMSKELEEYMDLYLDERERFLLKARFGFIEGISIVDLSEMYSISTTRVYKIIQDALDKLKKNCKVKKMKIYLR